MEVEEATENVRLVDQLAARDSVDREADSAAPHRLIPVGGD